MGADAFGYTADLRIDRGLAELLRLRVSQLNKSSYCLSLPYEAERGRASPGEIDAIGVVGDRASLRAEQAALRYTEALTRAADTDGDAAIQHFHDALAEHFSPEEMLEIVAVVRQHERLDPHQACRGRDAGPEGLGQFPAAPPSPKAMALPARTKDLDNAGLLGTARRLDEPTTFCMASRRSSRTELQPRERRSYSPGTATRRPCSRGGDYAARSTRDSSNHATWSRRQECAPGPSARSSWSRRERGPSRPPKSAVPSSRPCPRRGR